MFAYTTTEVSRLAGVERAAIYAAVCAHKNWRGIYPGKTPAGRLVWRSDQVDAVLGRLPPDHDLPHGVRAAITMLRDMGEFPDSRTLGVIQKLLGPPDPLGDHGVSDDWDFAVELVEAALNRSEAQFCVDKHYRLQTLSALRSLQSKIGNAIDSYEGGGRP